jgi:hypothetical protein
MSEQVLAISPILPGQKENPKFDIPPHSSTSPPQNENDRRQNRKHSAPPAGNENDLIDFGYPAANDKAVSTNKNIPSEHRNRSASLMDDDQHINAMNDKMGNMKLMEPSKTPASPPAKNEKPLKRTDTQTSEVDAFFDAEA